MCIYIYIYIHTYIHMLWYNETTITWYIWAVTFIPMPMPKTVCITNVYNEIARLEVCVELIRAGVWVWMSQLKWCDSLDDRLAIWSRGSRLESQGWGSNNSHWIIDMRTLPWIPLEDFSIWRPPPPAPVSSRRLPSSPEVGKTHAGIQVRNVLQAPMIVVYLYMIWYSITYYTTL